jgi:hypothetical protein
VACDWCPADAWLLDTCDGASQPLISAAFPPDGGLGWCHSPTASACTYGFPSSRAIYAAGDDALAAALASAEFAPASLSLGEARQIIAASFRKHASGFGVPCTVAANGSSCSGSTALLAVPGLLIKTVPGASTAHPPPSPGQGIADSAQPVKSLGPQSPLGPSGGSRAAVATLRSAPPGLRYGEHCQSTPGCETRRAARAAVATVDSAVATAIRVVPPEPGASRALRGRPPRWQARARKKTLLAAAAASAAPTGSTVGE